MEQRPEESKAEQEENELHDVPLPHHQPYPWLVLCHGELSRKRQFFYSIAEDRFYERFIPELHDSELVICSNHPFWLAYQDTCTLECFLLNTSTMDKVHLPPVEDLDDYRFCVLLSSSSIMKGRCRVVLFGKDPGTVLSCNLGDTEFINGKVFFEDFGKGRFDPFRGAVHFDGTLLVLTASYHLFTTDYSDTHISLKLIVEGWPLHDLLAMHTESEVYLVESFGDLFFIYTRFRDCELTDLKIFRADLTTREWVKVKSLGDRAIFLDAYNCFSSPASRFGLKKNCVYFVNRYGKNLNIFDLEDESISVSSPCPIAKSTSSLFWMLISDS